MRLSPARKTICLQISVRVGVLCLLSGLSLSIFSQTAAGCNIGELPSVKFPSRSARLVPSAIVILTAVAEKMKNNPLCKVAVTSYGANSKEAQQIGWDRVHVITAYLVEKQGISEERFVAKPGLEGGEPNMVDLADGTNEEGPNTVPAPHPNLRKKK